MITNAELKKHLAAERKTMREKQKQQKFMRRTLSFYHSEKKRAKENGYPELAYTLDELREFWSGDQRCYFCGTTLTIANSVPDHSDPLERNGTNALWNLVMVCKPCNWQKGVLDEDEFSRLLKLLESFDPKSAADVKRRLTVGGKFCPR